MKNLIPCNVPMFRPTSNLEILDEFVESNYECARLDGARYASPYVGANSLRASIERFGIRTIQVKVRKGEIYLIKIEP